MYYANVLKYGNTISNACQWVATPIYPYLFGCKLHKIFQRTLFNTPFAKRIRVNRHCYIPATPLEAYSFSFSLWT